MKKYRIWIIISLILILAAFLRLYRIADYMTFLGDEGRDVLAARNILHGHFTLLGPRSSAGDFYTGPIYYYLMAPFLFLFNYDPVGPAIMIALLGTATVFLVYYVGKKIFNESVGLIAASLYAVSPLVIIYSRSSWNPNAMPFFTLSLLYLLYIAVRNNSWKYFLGAGFLYGIALQLHYIELLVGVVIFCFTLFGFFYLKRKSFLILMKQYLTLFGGFIIGFSPFLLLELRHSFSNTRSISNFVIHGSPGATDLTKKSFIQIVQDVFFRVFGRIVWYYPSPDLTPRFDKSLLFVWQILIVVVACVSIFYIIKLKDKLIAVFFMMWLGFGVVLFGFYKKPINDYNFEFLFPLPFLITAYFLYALYKNNRITFAGKGIAIALFLFIFGHGLYLLPFKDAPNRQLQQVKTISEFVLSKTDNKPFNFALLTKGNSDHAYRYFFSTENKNPVTIENTIIDPARTSVKDQLLIVCEDTGCAPLGNPLFEVAGFGRAEIAGVWNVSVVKVYKMVHYHELNY